MNDTEEFLMGRIVEAESLKKLIKETEMPFTKESLVVLLNNRIDERERDLDWVRDWKRSKLEGSERL